MVTLWHYVKGHSRVVVLLWQIFKLSYKARLKQCIKKILVVGILIICSGFFFFSGTTNMKQIAMITFVEREGEK